MSQDAILGCFYLLNGLFAIRRSETQDLRVRVITAMNPKSDPGPEGR
jgi:hypothetical protein